MADLFPLNASENVFQLPEFQNMFRLPLGGGGPPGQFNAGLFSIPMSFLNPSATADQTFTPTVNQNVTQSSPFDISLNFSQIAGPGNQANASIFGLGGGKGGGGGGGSNYANFDPTINQVYVPPDYARPLGDALQGALSNSGLPFSGLPAVDLATPNTFRPPMPNAPIQGGIGMNVPANIPTPGLSALLGGNLAPNSAAAPLMGQQASPVSQGSPLSQMRPPIAPQGTPSSMGAAAMGMAPNFTAAAILGGSGQGGQPQLQSETPQMAPSQQIIPGSTKQNTPFSLPDTMPLKPCRI